MTYKKIGKIFLKDYLQQKFAEVGLSELKSKSINQYNLRCIIDYALLCVIVVYLFFGYGTTFFVMNVRFYSLI